MQSLEGFGAEWSKFKPNVSERLFFAQTFIFQFCGEKKQKIHQKIYFSTEIQAAALSQKSYLLNDLKLVFGE